MTGSVICRVLRSIREPRLERWRSWWKADAAGAAAIRFDGSEGASMVGLAVVRLVTAPAVALPPTALYDVTLIDDAGFDALQGVGLNRSATAAETASPEATEATDDTDDTTRLYVAAPLTLWVEHAGAGNAGVLDLYLSRGGSATSTPTR